MYFLFREVSNDFNPPVIVDKALLVYGYVICCCFLESTGVLTLLLLLEGFNNFSRT